MTLKILFKIVGLAFLAGIISTAGASATIFLRAASTEPQLLAPTGTGINIELNTAGDTVLRFTLAQRQAVAISFSGLCAVQAGQKTDVSADMDIKIDGVTVAVHNVPDQPNPFCSFAKGNDQPSAALASTMVFSKTLAKGSHTVRIRMKSNAPTANDLAIFNSSLTIFD